MSNLENASGKHIIWSNYNLDYEDFRGQIEDVYPDLPERLQEQMMYEINDDYLDDERRNLDIQLNQPILVIADLGLWFGHRTGYKEIATGNIKDCLQPDYDYNTWYVDDKGDLRCDSIHHDGCNHYRYRVYRDDISDEDKEYLLDKIVYGSVSEDEIAQYTKRLGDEIGKIYGWNFPEEPEPMIKTSVGPMPLRDYREYKANQMGYDNYDAFYNAGYRIGHGIDRPPEKRIVKNRER